MNTAFTFTNAQLLWSRIMAGWATHLDPSGARTLFDGIPNQHDAGGSYEGVTRMLWGLSAWLSQPERSRLVSWRGKDYDLAALTRQALVAGTDSHSPGYWGDKPDPVRNDQRTVESGQVAFALWQSRATIWEQLTSAQRAKLISWLEQMGQRPQAWTSNWALFWVLNHAGRKALGQTHDQATIDSGLDYLEGVYCGDGWYDDGAVRGVQHFDDYNLWVFTTHVLAWAECDGHSQPERCERLLKRVRLHMQHVPFFFGADGSYPEYGRSLSYKFARLGAPLWAYRLGCWPHSPGLLRRIVGRHLRWYIDRGALRADGTLRQELTEGGSAAIRETYISTGASYWAMLAFQGLWGLRDDDPFWTAPEEPLPVERGNFVKAFPQPGWLLNGIQATGAVQRYNAGSSAAYTAKYAKFVYASDAPFNVGLAHGRPSPDSMLCLGDERGYAHRSLERPAVQPTSTAAAQSSVLTPTATFALSEAGWLRMRYQQRAAGGQHLIDSTILVRGPVHVRAHRIELDTRRSPVCAIEGCAPLGYVPGDTPVIAGDTMQGWEYAEASGRAVAICALRGYDGQRQAEAWAGRADLNSVYAEHVLPVLSVSQLEQQHELVCLVYSGAPLHEPGALLRLISEIAWEADGTLYVSWRDGHIQRVPALR